MPISGVGGSMSTPVYEKNEPGLAANKTAQCIDLYLIIRQPTAVCVDVAVSSFTDAVDTIV